MRLLIKLSTTFSILAHLFGPQGTLINSPSFPWYICDGGCGQVGQDNQGEQGKKSNQPQMMGGWCSRNKKDKIPVESEDVECSSAYTDHGFP